MLVGSVSANYSAAARLTSVSKSETTVSTSSTSASSSAAQGDQVSLSANAARYQQNYVIIQQVLVNSEDSVAFGEDLFQAAGKADFMDRAAQATDFSPEAVSGRIFDGITGYIFGAFANSRPNATAEDFSEFQSQVMEGVERGVSDAREILDALQAMNPQIDDTITQTVDLLYEKLDKWFEETAKMFSPGEQQAQATG